MNLWNISIYSVILITSLATVLLWYFD